MSDGTYYWLRLQNDFFKRHDIKVIENMPNGKDYIIFYLKLLCESTSHEGRLRFNDEIPYSDEMLSIVTDTNIDIVRNAIQVFEKLKMIEVLDDGTFFMKQVEKMVGSETKWAKIKRNYRNEQKQIGQCPTDVQKQIGNCPIELEKEIELEKDIKKNNKEKAKHKYGNYKHVLLTDDEFQNLQNDYPNANDLIEFFDSYIEEKGYKSKSHYLSIKRWVVNAVEKDKPKVEKKETYEMNI